MKKNTFKKVISILTASLMSVMSVSAFPVSAVESYAEPAPLYELSTTTTTTTTTIAACYATQVEYDNSDVAVGDTVAVRFWNPETGTAANAQFMEVSDNISYEYEEGSDTVYITALEPGEAKMYILAEGCAFGAYVTFKVTDSGSQSTGTTSTSITTTTAAYTTILQQRLAFNFDAPKDTIAVGEEMTVKLYSTFKAEYWSESELPEHYVNDPSIAAVEIGEEAGTFKITGLSAGSTFVRFIEEGYADFRITVAEGGTVTTTTTTETTDLFTTTTGYGIQLACSEENVTLYPGHTQSFYLYYKTGPTSFSESYPVTFEFDNEGIAAVTPDPYGGVSDYVIEALAQGSTKLTIKQQYGNDTLTCEMNITVQPQVTTVPPDEDDTTKTTMITTAAPALLCSPSAVTVEVGKRQPIIMSYANGMKISQNPTDYESDNAAVAAAEQGEYSYICYVEGVSEGTANISITPPYGYDNVTIPVTVIPADDDDSNDASVHIVVEEKFYDMIPKGGSLDLSDSIYSVYKYDGTSSRMEKVLSQVSMDAETENVTVDASAFDSSAPGYYDIIITYTDDDGYTDTVTLCAAVYYFDWMDTTTPPVTTTTTTSITTSGLELDSSNLYVILDGEEYVRILSATGGVYPTFEIEDESIAEVIPDEDSFGFYVKGLAQGTTTIKVIDGENHIEYLEVNVLQWATTMTTTATTNTSDTVYTTTITNLTTPESSTAPIQTTITSAMGIVLSDSEIELEAGQRFGIGISKTDGRDYFDGYLVECTSDNPEIAVVQHSDIPYEIFIVGMAEGTANITVYDPAFGSTANLQVTVTGTADNTIGNKVSIVVDSEPLKLQYNIGEELDLTGGVYRVVMDSTGDNFYGPWDMTAGRTITAAFDSTTAGTYPIYISYNNPIYGYWDVYVFYVTVADQSAGAEKGDINQDGTVGIDDATAVLDYYAKTAAGIDTAAITSNADIDGDGNITMSDATYILTYYAMTSAGLPCTWEDVITG